MAITTFKLVDLTEERRAALVKDDNYEREDSNIILTSRDLDYTNMP